MKPVAPQSTTSYGRAFLASRDWAVITAGEASVSSGSARGETRYPDAGRPVTPHASPAERALGGPLPRTLRGARMPLAFAPAPRHPRTENRLPLPRTQDALPFLPASRASAALCSSPWPSSAPALGVRADGVVPAPVEIPATLSMDDAIATFRARGFGPAHRRGRGHELRGRREDRRRDPQPDRERRLRARIQLRSQSSKPARRLFDANSYSVGLSDNSAIEDSLAGKRGLRLKVAHAALAAAKMSRLDAQRNLEFQVKAAYVQVILAANSLDFAIEIQKSNKATLDLNQRRYDKGAINEGDLARVKTTKLEADQAVRQRRGRPFARRASRSRSCSACAGACPEFDVDRTVLKYRVPATLQSSSPDALLRQAFERRPDLRAARLPT